ncbi:hypothetical protein OS493_026445 [Desmophyllum pertusum]|uniref:Uncharacterized protein n=1 Tax=Desmophyllum pertusum TaxID=174260 RepID=A0A9W9YZ11_9CNID|nr:hypothetical protein OS493_026445 [Desmophyllum pertusum]
MSRNQVKNLVCATEENQTTANSPREQFTPQKPPSPAPVRGPSTSYSTIYEDDVSTIQREYLTLRTAAGYNNCLSYEGYHEHGFHLLALYPRLFLEMLNDNGHKINSLPCGEYSAALEQFLGYIQGVIKSKVKDDAFVIVFRDVPDKVGVFYTRCDSFTRRACDSLQKRFGKSLKSIVIYRPAGLIAFKLAKRSRKKPFARLAITETKLVIASNLIKLAKATGFPGRIIPKKC